MFRRKNDRRNAAEKNIIYLQGQILPILWQVAGVIMTGECERTQGND